MEWVGSCGKTDENGHVLSLTRLCLLSLANNMKDMWAKDYADNYLDHYSFRYIMGPFTLLRECDFHKVLVVKVSFNQMDFTIHCSKISLTYISENGIKYGTCTK